MSAVQITLTGEQLASAYVQLSLRERRSFLQALVAQPSHQQALLDLIKESRAVLKKKFSAAKQRELDRLLDKNNEGKLTQSEQERLDQLMAEYGEGLVEKARAVYVLNLTDQT
jgi:hypothetical protein